jgi:alpha 1,3-glucosidase
LTGIILKTIKNGEKVRLPVTISFLENGAARVTLDEEKRQNGEIELRHNSQARKERFNEAAKYAIAGGLAANKGAALSSDAAQGTSVVKYGPRSQFEAVIRHTPFGIDFKRDGVTQIQFNDRGLLNMEHWRAKKEPSPPPEKKEGEAEGPAAPPPVDENAEDESTWWEESFGGSTDSKPRGPESVGLDISFPGYDVVYGIPEHAGPLALKQTRYVALNEQSEILLTSCSGGDNAYTQPYRLYNSDVFEYELDSPMTLYGAIPLMQAHRKDSTVGVFWLNAAETWIDIVKSKNSVNPLSLGIKSTTTTQTHWFSESGLLDVFVFLGPTPKDVIKTYTELTGTTSMPPEFAMAYHQCRWNYVTDDDVMDVDRRFDKFNIPYDVIWLDIEYTEGKKYFTWDPLTFDDPEAMHKQLAKRERKQVIIIDPHIKNTNSYPVVDELKKKDLAVKNKEGKIYDGWCWPGSSHWIDCFNPATFTWWKSLFQYDKFKGTMPNTWIWVDMNEPSVFNGPDMTMPRDNLHYDNWEHRDVHNINGMTIHNATYLALKSRSKAEEKSPRRPFVLTRSFYAGSQRISAMWTGDNLAEWSHLAVSLPMVLNQGISGYPFAGADVGGFFGNPSKELLTRWYQTGIWYPFFRAHAHIDTRRREPYLAGDPYMGIITDALKVRYSLLPTWYTAFHEASVSGAPIVRPNFYVHPEDEAGFTLDDQITLGSSGIIAKPVVTEGAESVDIYLGDDATYYDYFDYSIVQGKGRHNLKAALDKIPVLIRSGHIFPRRDRFRRSSGLMKMDPYTLVIALGADGKAEGEIYVDDGESYEFEQGAFIHRKFVFENGALRSEDLAESKGKLTEKYLKRMESVRVEKVIIIGAPKEWKKLDQVNVKEEGGKASGQSKSAKLDFHAGERDKADWAVVRDPKVAIGKGWSIEFA